MVACLRGAWPLLLGCNLTHLNQDELNGKVVDGRAIRVDYSETLRAHTPTPGIYKGIPTYGAWLPGFILQHSPFLFFFFFFFFSPKQRGATCVCRHLNFCPTHSRIICPRRRD